MPKVIDEPSRNSVSRTSQDKFLMDNEITGTHSIDYANLLDTIASDIGTVHIIAEAYPRSGATELSSIWLSTTSSGQALTPNQNNVYILMANSINYSKGSQFRWSSTAYCNINVNGIKPITNGEIDDIYV